MPIISQFYGILIYMYRELGSVHNKPHIHVRYNEYEMTISIKGEKLNGNIPKKQKKLVDAWIALHEEELEAAWYALNNDGEIIKIKGLEWLDETKSYRCKTFKRL
mgnify:CR=1 FL=1